MSKPKIRSTIIDTPVIDRYEIIRSAISRFNKAINHSFFLEPSALIKNLICDRLESRIGELTNKPVEFVTIGDLLKKNKKNETDVASKGL